MPIKPTSQLRIKHLKVDNFKSLVGFKIDLAKFSCLIGLNGSGKSIVLQFADFLAQQLRGNFTEWLKERVWEPRDLASRLTGKKLIDFDVSLVDGNGCNAGRWQATFNPSLLRCTKERIRVRDAELVVEGGSFRVEETSDAIDLASDVVHHSPSKAIDFKYEGSILSQLVETGLPEGLKAFKHFFENLKSLDLLAPQSLRQRTRESDGSLGLGGQRLSAFVHELGQPGRTKLVSQLRQAYKQLRLVETKSLRSGWKQLGVVEMYGKHVLRTEARHVNDGMLRLMAVLAELQTKHQVVLFDEIENGINPELIEFVLDALSAAKQQVIVTTHSPMILNYLDDETARQGVIYLYKTANGSTQSVPFFSIPSLADKLTMMGPGEAFVDTNLTELSEEISRMTEGA